MDIVCIVDNVAIVDLVDIVDILDVADIVDIVDIGGYAEYTRPFRRIHSPAEYTRIPPNTLEWASNLRKYSAEYTRMLAEYTRFFAEYTRISPNTLESPECIQRRIHSNQFFL